jgi:hypothetical protein
VLGPAASAGGPRGSGFVKPSGICLPPSIQEYSVRCFGEGDRVGCCLALTVDQDEIRSSVSASNLASSTVPNSSTMESSQCVLVTSSPR